MTTRQKLGFTAAQWGRIVFPRSPSDWKLRLSIKKSQRPKLSSLFGGKQDQPYKILKVDYSDEVTAEQVKKIDELVAPEFKGGNWKTVESES